MSQIRIAIRHFPDIKKPCLMLEKDNKGIVLAKFQNEAMEDLFVKAVECISINQNIDLEGQL